MSENTEKCCCSCGCSADEQAKYDQIAAVIDQYKGKEGSLIMVLHSAQQIYGYLPLDLQKFIADRMGLPLSEVYGVVSFYSFFSTQERGKHTIRICLGTACYVRGGAKLVEALEDKLQVKVGGVTADKKFTLEVARCIGACGLAPAIMVDNDVHKQMSPATLDDMLSQY
ncbi:MAG: NAD(P)H-dependent oxidoreductase subunit E [Firmicutes bacterium]|jgi:NADH:ubiquinone oxidoreductase subunit E|nr:NAD(P)H-dependent oxidoreductase subunit E [Bacillota bacterium]MBQ6535358.1 NAD(P)H-dependent oxidoreductase subunit E [Bacillota bacterium]MBQ6606336.1 NAD(P)H-dependent oxidoreductase subunit E [Bacillota bacterium]